MIAVDRRGLGDIVAAMKVTSADAAKIMCGGDGLSIRNSTDGVFTMDHLLSIYSLQCQFIDEYHRRKMLVQRFVSSLSQCRTSDELLPTDEVRHLSTHWECPTESMVNKIEVDVFMAYADPS